AAAGAAKPAASPSGEAATSPASTGASAGATDLADAAALLWARTAAAAMAVALLFGAALWEGCCAAFSGRASLDSFCGGLAFRRARSTRDDSSSAGTSGIGPDKSIKGCSALAEDLPSAFTASAATFTTTCGTEG